MGANLSKDKSVPKTDAATAAKAAKSASKNADNVIKTIVSSSTDLKSSDDIGASDDAVTIIDADLHVLEVGAADAPASSDSDAVQLVADVVCDSQPVIPAVTSVVNTDTHDGNNRDSSTHVPLTIDTNKEIPSTVAVKKTKAMSSMESQLAKISQGINCCNNKNVSKGVYDPANTSIPPVEKDSKIQSQSSDIVIINDSVGIIPGSADIKTEEVGEEEKSPELNNNSIISELDITSAETKSILASSKPVLNDITRGTEALSIGAKELVPSGNLATTETEKSQSNDTFTLKTMETKSKCLGNKISIVNVVKVTERAITLPSALEQLSAETSVLDTMERSVTDIPVISAVQSNAEHSTVSALGTIEKSVTDIPVISAVQSNAVQLGSVASVLKAVEKSAGSVATVNAVEDRSEQLSRGISVLNAAEKSEVNITALNAVREDNGSSDDISALNVTEKNEERYVNDVNTIEKNEECDTTNDDAGVEESPTVNEKDETDNDDEHNDVCANFEIDHHQLTRASYEAKTDWWAAETESDSRYV